MVKIIFSLILLAFLGSISTVAPAANWWDKFGEPQYGGTITRAEASLDLRFDPYNFTVGGIFFSMFFEPLLMHDWTLDRNIWSFANEWTPAEYWVGNTAESWEFPDPSTMVLHLRKGVHWQDKEPVNGREFTADDVVYHYDRLRGTGHGFTKPSPFYGPFFASFKEVTAPDNYTVVIKFISPAQIINLWAILEPIGMLMEAPEGVNAPGGLDDWHNAVGTGPWILTDYQANSSLTFSKNPNYWAYDERHPRNRLPYADGVKILCIPDEATRLAGLRTGKIDFEGSGLSGITWQKSQSLIKTNPELQHGTKWSTSQVLQLRNDKKPFTDIKVRIALQMALDLKTIAKTYYGGSVDGIPCGIIHPVYKGYNFAYADWPQSLKDEYSYNPTKAKKLLAEAGYPSGFKTNVIAPSNQDLQLLQIIKSYFMDINVDMEIKEMDPVAGQEFARAGKHNAMYYGGDTANKPPRISIENHMTGFWMNVSYNNDSTYDAMVTDKFKRATDLSEAKKVLIELDKYYLQAHWNVITFPTVNNVFWQPFLKGYSGELLQWGHGIYVARWWIDQSLKK